MTTARRIYRELLEMPVSERERLFAIIARRGFEKDSYTHDEVFGDLSESRFTVKEAAEYLGVSMITVRRWMRDKILKADGKVGRSWMFDADKLSAFKKNA